MASTTNDARHPDPSPAAKPNPRATDEPRAEQTLDCHPVDPAAAPSSAAENREEANQKCDVTGPQTASKDEHEKATG